MPGLRTGVNLNDLGFADPKRSGLPTLGDWVIGTAARQALPARIELAQTCFPGHYLICARMPSSSSRLV